MSESHINPYGVLAGMTNKLAWLIGLPLTYFGVGLATDTYRRQTKLVKAQLFAGLVHKPLLNLSCGTTAFGDVNADIIPQDVPHFVRFEPNKPLPWGTKYFGAAYSSHTLEHSDDPIYLLSELNRVADRVFLALPAHWLLTTFDPSHVWIPMDQSGLKWKKNPFYNREYALKQNPKFHGNPFVG